MIRFDNVSKRYRGAPRPALDQVSLEIGAGEFVFLVGASGSGKSSLLRLMLREEKPSVGEIHVLGQRLTTISTRKVPYFRRSLGVVFQDFRLLPNKTVHDNVAFTLQVLGRSRGFIQQTVPDVLETVGLADKAQNFPNELSGGEQQRVAIARAVVNKPAILLADEPTGNLDPRTSDGIMQVLERINVQGTTVVMATHDVSIVDRLQKRVVELVNGSIVRDEQEASYVTSSIRIPRADPAEQAVEEEPVAIPVWQRRGRGVPTGEIGVVGGRPRTAPILRPVTTEVWARTDAGPALLPGEHAPWRAAPVSPTGAEAGSDGEERDVFVATPRPAPRTGQLPVIVPPAADTGSEDDHEADLPRIGRVGNPEVDLDDTGDQEELLRRFGRHRDRLPDHLDFVTGLNLRQQAQKDDADEVGPTS